MGYVSFGQKDAVFSIKDSASVKVCLSRWLQFVGESGVEEFKRVLNQQIPVANFMAVPCKTKIKKGVRKVHSHLSVTDDLKGPQHLTKSQFAYTVLRNIHQLFSHEN